LPNRPTEDILEAGNIYCVAGHLMPYADRQYPTLAYHPGAADKICELASAVEYTRDKPFVSGYGIVISCHRTLDGLQDTPYHSLVIVLRHKDWDVEVCNHYKSLRDPLLICLSSVRMGKSHEGFQDQVLHQDQPGSNQCCQELYRWSTGQFGR
jgi:hypothetical protein